MRSLILISVLFFAAAGYASEIGHGGGPVPVSRCIPEARYKAVCAQLEQIDVHPDAFKDDVLFDDPMGGGGMNSFGKTVTNYVDLDSLPVLLDYNCGTVCYDGHQGTDIELLNFYDMDEGVPLLCAAPGVVTYVHDGEYDRHTEFDGGAVANAVIVTHSDGSEAWYWHMRKNSVNVTLGQTVAVGDTLGYVGSSGYSTAPHIHFEIQYGGTVDPSHGPCQPDSSRWVSQGAYVLDLPFELMDHGLTTIPLDWATVSERPPTKTHVTAPGPVYSWIRLRNVQATDELTWVFLANGSLWDHYTFSPGATYSSSYWYIYWYLPYSDYGDWTIQIYRNGGLMAEQDFAYDANPNQLPTIANRVLEVDAGVPHDDEFVADDPDGSIFWYVVDSGPGNGSLEQYGGRARKLTYTADTGFSGLDTVRFHAIDDDSAAGPIGQYVFDVTDPTAIGVHALEASSRFNLRQNTPNPFNPRTEISFALPETDHVTLRIFTVSGRRVTTLLDDQVSSGVHRVSWDGKDGRGRDMASGVYLYTLEVDDTTESRRMLLLK